jgi:hypothetical protein
MSMGRMGGTYEWMRGESEETREANEGKEETSEG